MFEILVWYKGHERTLLASLIEFDSNTMVARVCDEALRFPLSDVIDVTPVYHFAAHENHCHVGSAASMRTH